MLTAHVCFPLSYFARCWCCPCHCCSHYYQPENQDDVVAIVADCAKAKRRLRVLGSGLSPNGIGFSDEGMMSMALLDRVLWVDPESMQVGVSVLLLGEGCVQQG